MGFSIKTRFLSLRNIQIEEMSASLRRHLPKFEVYPLRPVLAWTQSTACLFYVLFLL